MAATATTTTASKQPRREEIPTPPHTRISHGTHHRAPTIPPQPPHAHSAMAGTYSSGDEYTLPWICFHSSKFSVADTTATKAQATMTNARNMAVEVFELSKWW